MQVGDDKYLLLHTCSSYFVTETERARATYRKGCSLIGPIGLLQPIWTIPTLSRGATPFSILRPLKITAARQHC
eukprot:scaffold72_cov88-Skeletonema_dohrnii-CCMP3373.AAC.3